MSRIVEASELRFSYSGEFIMDLARIGYWFENRRDWALRLLKCVRVPPELSEDQIFYLQSRGLTVDQIWSMMPHKPLSDEQAMAVLKGNAVLTDDSEFVRRDDKDFQRSLSDRQKDFVEVGDYLIARHVVENYFKQLEQPGSPRETFEAVLKAAGFARIGYTFRGRPKVIIDKTPGSLGFQSALLKLGQIYLRAREKQ